MSLSYQDLIHGVLLRINGMNGTDPAALEITYAKTNLTSADATESADFPWSSVKDACLLAEEDRAKEIANNRDDALRSYLHAVTANVPNHGTIPSVSSASDPRIGVFGTIRDATDGKPLTQKPLAVVRRLVAETWRLYPLYHFAFEGDRIEHTRTNVTFDICVYNRATRKTAIDANGNSVLPESEEGWLISRAVSYLVKDDQFMAQAAMYRGYSGAQAA